MGALSAGQAQALVVNVGGQDWDVTTFSWSYEQNTAKFNTANNGGVMPWWFDQGLALDFASAVGSDLGFPNDPIGPYFVFRATSEAVFS